MLVVVDYPDLAERTGRFRYGAPHAVEIGGGGAPGGGRPPPRRPAPRPPPPGLPPALVPGTHTPVATAEVVIGPRPDPAGRYVGYLTPADCLRIVGPQGQDE